MLSLVNGRGFDTCTNFHYRHWNAGCNFNEAFSSTNLYINEPQSQLGRLIQHCTEETLRAKFGNIIFCCSHSRSGLFCYSAAAGLFTVLWVQLSDWISYKVLSDMISSNTTCVYFIVRSPYSIATFVPIPNYILILSRFEEHVFMLEQTNLSGLRGVSMQLDVWVWHCIVAQYCPSTTQKK